MVVVPPSEEAITRIRSDGLPRSVQAQERNAQAQERKPESSNIPPVTASSTRNAPAVSANRNPSAHTQERSPEPATQVKVTSSGRVVKPPSRFSDYVK